MAVAKTLGLETEYGIVHRGRPEPNPITASSLLINAYLNRHGYETGARSESILWDFIDETPGVDARGFSPVGSMAPQVETHLVNAVLRNGARYYVDHAHPEMSTPECADPLSVVRYDRAGELIVQASVEAANELLPDGEELILYKNNSDGKGNSYGTHENYLVDRSTPFGQLVRHCTSHFITRQIFTGAGKVGSELPGQRTDEVDFQLTQRADFFEEEVGLETTLKRPIINTRDEPHADARRYRRLHVIVGDANLSQVATFLKVGTTTLVLAMIEDDAIDTVFEFDAPVAAIRQVSHDLQLCEPLLLTDGSTIHPLRRTLRNRQRRRASRHRRAPPLGTGTPWPRNQPVDAGQPTRLGCQISTAFGLSRTPRSALERRPAPRHGHPVQRHASRSGAGLAGGS